MKYIFGFFLVCCSFSFSEDIYSLSIKNINGRTIPLSQYRGKKMMFIILPLSAVDTNLSVTDLLAFQNRYQDSLVVIGVPAMETGFGSVGAQALQILYGNRDTSFLLAEGMRVTKSSGEQQSPIFQWLTSKDKNTHFTQEVGGVGHKFFVDEQGELYAAISPKTKLSSPIITKILARRVRSNPSRGGR